MAEKKESPSGNQGEDLQSDAKVRKIVIPDGTDLNNLIEQDRFPTDSFPTAIQNVINATNDSLQFPKDYIGAALVYAASIAIGNTTQVKVKDGWNETTVMYLALVGKPGTNKTHPLSWAIAPILKRDAETFREYKNLKSEFESNNSLSRKDREELGLPTQEKPTWKKLLVSDVTPEALAEIHSFNLRGLGLYTDELAGWFKNFNRYHKGGEQEFWLSNWSHKPVIIDRKGGDPVFIHNPFISVGGTIQNGVLSELAKESRTQNGFIDRILFVVPESSEKTYWSESSLEPSITHAWNLIIDKLLSIPLFLNDNSQIIPEVVTYSPDAYKTLKEWQRGNTDLCNQLEDEYLAGTYSKLEIYCIRLSLILHMLEWSCSNTDKLQIQEHTVTGAIKLIEYFRISAKRVQGIISANPTDKLPEDKRKIYSELPKEFSTEEGVEIAKASEMPERTFKRFITDSKFFKHIKRGQYEKRYY